MCFALSFTQKFADGKVPELVNPSETDLEALKAIQQQKEKVTAAFESFKFKEAIQESLNLARVGNKYFTETEPWKTRKDNPQACNNTLYVSNQICAALGVLMDPVLPDSMKKLRTQLGMNDEISWVQITEEMIPAGTAVDAGEVLFTKVENEQIEAQIKRLEERAAANDPAINYATQKEY